MIPKKYLYNTDEFAVNDLIRDAHPYGGTEVVSTESGEGLVEDIIEAQLKTLDMVFRQPTLKILAELGNSLDKGGMHIMASEVDEVLKKFASIEAFAEGDSLTEDEAARIGNSLSNDISSFVSDTFQPFGESLLEDNKISQTEFPVSDILEEAEALFELWASYFSSGLTAEELSKLVLQFGSDVNEFSELFSPIKTRYSKPRASYLGGFEITEVSVPEDPKYKDVFSTWRDLVAQYFDMFKEKDYSGIRGGQTPAKERSHAENMKQIQITMNEIAKEKVVEENGQLGDKNTWNTLKNDPFNLHAKNKEGEGDFSSYTQLLSLLERMLGGKATKQVGSSGKAKQRDQASKGGKSDVKYDREVTDITFDYKGNTFKHFPLAYLLKEVDVKDNRQMAKAASMYVQTLIGHGILLNKTLPNLLVELPQIRKALLEAKLPGTDRTLVQQFPRIASYLSAINQYYNLLSINIERAKNMKKNTTNVFDHLATKFPTGDHIFYKIIADPETKLATLRFLHGKHPYKIQMDESMVIGTTIDLIALESRMRAIGENAWH